MRRHCEPAGHSVPLRKQGYMTRLAFVAGFSAVVTLSGVIHAQLADQRSRREALQTYRVGTDLLSTGRFEQAVEQFRRAIEKDRLLVEAHYELGQAYMGLRQYPSAIKAYQNAIAASRSLHNLEQENRAAVERALDDRIWEIDRLIRSPIAPDESIQELAARRRQLEFMRRRGESIADSLEPQAESLFALGSAYFRNGQLMDAEAQWKAALMVKPSMGKAHNNLAVLYMLTGRLEEADEEMRRAESTGTQVKPQLKEDLKKIRGR